MAALTTNLHLSTFMQGLVGASPLIGISSAGHSSAASRTGSGGGRCCSSTW
ncbi:hypothetical protein ACIRPX_36575 [Streptomyces sp. NPDC101225]|uniref:hypothetical protein n=1 Tax=Streptomyces sp. NPDC101225 TaxID=3366135 RepID=UPI00382D1CA2